MTMIIKISLNLEKQNFNKQAMGSKSKLENYIKEINKVFLLNNLVVTEEELKPKLNESKFERKPGENYRSKYVAP
jgi:hypothetical protein